MPGEVKVPQTREQGRQQILLPTLPQSEGMARLGGGGGRTLGLGRTVSL